MLLTLMGNLGMLGETKKVTPVSAGNYDEEPRRNEHWKKIMREDDEILLILKAALKVIN